MSFLHENWTRMTALNQRKRRREKKREEKESGYDFFMKTTRFEFLLRSIIFCASGFSSWSCLNRACCSIRPYLSAPRRIFENDEFWPTNDPFEKSGQNFDLGAKTGSRGSARDREIFWDFLFLIAFAIANAAFPTTYNLHVIKKCQPIRLQIVRSLGGQSSVVDSRGMEAPVFSARYPLQPETLTAIMQEFESILLGSLAVPQGCPMASRWP